MKQNIIKRIIRRIESDIKEQYIYWTNPRPKVLNVYKTIDKIKNDKCSVSRIGDGEFGIILMSDDIGFQKKDEKLSQRLKEVLNSDENNLLVCIPDIFNKNEYKRRTKVNRKWWKDYMRKHRKDWYEYIDFNKIYGATNFTRYYITRKDKSDCKDYFDKVREIWKDKDIIIVEGEKTRCGIGNDLFDNAKSIKRILAPAENAFEEYEEILSAIENNVDKTKLILMALGPTATILAYDLNKKGYQAIDIGHMDVEYEWFLKKAEDRINLDNKYVNESNDNSFSNSFKDEKYEAQIIKIV